MVAALDHLSDEEILRLYVERYESEGRGWCPQEPTERQREFLDLDCLEALYGGAAGGGKSSALLIGALQHVDTPGYAALLLRRTYADLALPGAIMDRAAEWLEPTSAHWDGQDKTWTFPSGATLTFGYLDTESHKYRYQGSEFQFIGFDELTQFTESQYTYLMSRLRRRAGVEVPLRMRAATNPGGRGHDWVKRRFIESTRRPFIPARLADNPHVDRESYRLALSELDETTKRQLLEGVWVKESTGLVYRYDPQRNAVSAMPRGQGWHYIWAIDFGASQRHPTEAVSVLAYSYHDPATYVVRSERRPSRTMDEIAQEYHAARLEYGGFAATVIDQGALGAKIGRELAERYSMPTEHAEKSNKLGYRRLLNGALEQGKVKVVEPGCKDLIDEFESLEWNEAGTDCGPGAPDHCSDSVLYAWRKAKSFLAKAEAQPPPDGTRERADYEARLMFEQAVAGTGASKPWWDKS